VATPTVETEILIQKEILIRNPTQFAVNVAKKQAPNDWLSQLLPATKHFLYSVIGNDKWLPHNKKDMIQTDDPLDHIRPRLSNVAVMPIELLAWNARMYISSSCGSPSFFYPVFIHHLLSCDTMAMLEPFSNSAGWSPHNRSLKLALLLTWNEYNEWLPAASVMLRSRLHRLWIGMQGYQQGRWQYSSAIGHVAHTPRRATDPQRRMYPLLPASTGDKFYEMCNNMLLSRTDRKRLWFRSKCVGDEFSYRLVEVIVM